MKNIIKPLAVVGVLLAAGSARASLDIPDGNPVGVASTLGVSGLGTIDGDISVTLNISGGNNGDLYAYLSYNGTLVTLLNQPGVGPGNPLGDTDSGYNVVLSDGAYGNINNATGSGTVSGTFNAAGGATALSAYNGTDSTGTWTLFIADLSGGDSSDSQLNSWYLTINGNTVPEPITEALVIFGLFGAATQWLVWRARRKAVGGKKI